MPNHITNGVTITHEDKTKLKQLIKNTIKEDNGEQTFDFNGILPMPKVLLEIHSGANTIDGKAVDAWREIDGKSIAISDKENEELIQKYKSNNWYDWSIQNWGTKWNAYSVSVIEASDTKLVIEFNTAWSTPQGIWDELERQGFEVNGVWLDEGGGDGCINDGSGWGFSKEIEYYG